MRLYVPINIDDIPDIFDINLAGETYTFRIDYNEVKDYYLITILDSDGNTLLGQEPLLLGQLVGIDIPRPELPETDLKTMDETGRATDAGQGEFGFDVKLYEDDVDPNGSDNDPDVKPLGYDPDESPDDYSDEEVSI